MVISKQDIINVKNNINNYIIKTPVLSFELINKICDCEVFFKCENLNDLSLFLKEFRSEKNILVLGAGSNILFSDNLYDGAIIKLGKILRKIIFLFG